MYYLKQKNYFCKNRVEGGGVGANWYFSWVGGGTALVAQLSVNLVLNTIPTPFLHPFIGVGHLFCNTYITPR